MASLNEIVDAARTAWLANYTTGDEKWRLRQLHGLYNFVVDNRDTIVSALSSQDAIPAIVYEQEIAVFVRELDSQISKLTKKSPDKLVKSLNRGKVHVEEQPHGVSLIICNSSNFIRYALSPLAASITANNVVILATTSDLDGPIVECLQREWSKYLSPESLFFLPGIDTDIIDPDRVDHIAILDRSPEKYSNILQRTTAHFYTLEAGYNIAIVDEGKKDWKNLAKQVFGNTSRNALPADRLHAVFVRREETATFQKQLGDVWVSKKGIGYHEKFSVAECVPWGNNIFCLDPERSNSAATSSIEPTLNLMQTMGGLLVVSITSLDQALDLLNEISSPIQQLALLAPGPKNTIEYVKKWVRTSTFSVGSIRKVLPPVFDSFPAHSSLDSLFPSSLFSKSHIVAEETAR